MEASARITCSFLGLRPGNTAMLCMPLEYIAGKMMVVRSMVCELRLVSVPPSGHPFSFATGCETAIYDFGRQSPFPPFPGSLAVDGINPGHETGNGLFYPELDFVAMVPMQVHNTLQVAEERERLMRVKHLIIGGGAVDDAMERDLSAFPHAVWSTYGMTETLSHIALRRINGSEASRWYTPFEQVGIRLNEEGCLVIDAPAVCPSQLVTNDRAEIAPDGRRFRILGRKDNVICSGGIKIQMEEVERALKPHLPYSFLITKRRDSKFGEIVVLLIQDADVSAARTICEQVLPRYWRPRLYIPVPSLPVTETGKPARAEAEKIASCCIAPV